VLNYETKNYYNLSLSVVDDGKKSRCSLWYSLGLH
jgi:hypothetical protein